MPDTNQTKLNCPNRETSIVWNEAGFIPPVLCQNVIEFLHRLYNDDIENIYDNGLIMDHICDIGEKTTINCSEYIFTDRKQMYHFAEEMGISAEKVNDTEIADEIICRLIGEYTGEKSACIKKSGIMEVLYKISTCIA